MTSTLVLGAVIRLVLKHPKYTCNIEINTVSVYVFRSVTDYTSSRNVSNGFAFLCVLGNQMAAGEI